MVPIRVFILDGRPLHMQWRWKKFQELNIEELYEIIRLRERVFVVEQNCVYLDADGLDLSAWHLMGFDQNQLVTYLRVLPPGIKFQEVSFGRVVTAPEARKKGYGKELSKQAIQKIEQTWGPVHIRISAQAYLENFYGGFGFKREGSGYLEDGIPHIEMLRG